MLDNTRQYNICIILDNALRYIRLCNMGLRFGSVIITHLLRDAVRADDNNLTIERHHGNSFFIKGSIGTHYICGKT